jgi:hypothetical protein
VLLREGHCCNRPVEIEGTLDGRRPGRASGLQRCVHLGSQQRPAHCSAHLPTPRPGWPGPVVVCPDCERLPAAVVCAHESTTFGTPMEVFKLLFQSEYGLFSLGVILFMIVMAIYMFGRFRKLMNDKPGKEGW